MIISRAEIESAIAAYRTSRRRRAHAAPSVSFDTQDAYVSSTEAATLTDLAAGIAAEPLYRDALVHDIRRRIAEGKYYVPSDQVVEKLLGRLVLAALPA